MINGKKLIEKTVADLKQMELYKLYSNEDLLFKILYEKYKDNWFTFDDINLLLINFNNCYFTEYGTDDYSIKNTESITYKIPNIQNDLNSLLNILKNNKYLHYDRITQKFSFTNNNNFNKKLNTLNSKESYYKYINDNIKNIKINWIFWLTIIFGIFTVIGTIFTILQFFYY